MDFNPPTYGSLDTYTRWEAFQPPQDEQSRIDTNKRTANLGIQTLDQSSKDYPYPSGTVQTNRPTPSEKDTQKTFELTDDHAPLCFRTKRTWSFEDMDYIKDTIKKKGLTKETLDELASSFNKKRKETSKEYNFVEIYITYILNTNKPKERTLWNEQEVKCLLLAVKKYGYNWKFISVKCFKGLISERSCYKKHLQSKETPSNIPNRRDLKPISAYATLPPPIKKPSDKADPIEKRKGLLKDFDIDFEKTEIVSIRPVPVNNNEFKLTDEHCKCIERRKGNLLNLEEQCIVSTIEKEGLTKKTLQKLSKDIEKRTFVEIYLIYISLTVKAYGDRLPWSEEESALLAIAAEKYENRFAFISCKCFKGLKSASECRRRFESMRPEHRERLVRRFRPTTNGKRKQPERATEQLKETNEIRAGKRPRIVSFDLPPGYNNFAPNVNSFPTEPFAYQQASGKTQTTEPTQYRPPFAESPMYNPPALGIQEALANIPVFTLTTECDRANKPEMPSTDLLQDYCSFETNSNGAPTEILAYQQESRETQASASTQYMTQFAELPPMYHPPVLHIQETASLLASFDLTPESEMPITFSEQMPNPGLGSLQDFQSDFDDFFDTPSETSDNDL